MATSAVEWLIDALAFRLLATPDDRDHIQQHLTVLFDYFKGVIGQAESRLSPVRQKTWKGMLLLKCLDANGIARPQLRWLQPETTRRSGAHWIYEFAVEGEGNPEFEIAKTIQTLLDLLVLEGYALQQLSAKIELIDGPLYLRRPRSPH